MRFPHLDSIQLYIIHTFPIERRQILTDRISWSELDTKMDSFERMT